MPHRTPIALTIVVILTVGFTFTLSSAAARSGDDAGSLWLFTSLILGLGLIGAALAATASIVQSRRQARPDAHRDARPGAESRGRHPPTAHP